MSVPDDLLAGRYRLVRLVASGGMGVVWEGWDELLERSVAIKMLRTVVGATDAEAKLAESRALREARIAARLHHPNAVPVFDVVDLDGQPCLIMQFLQSMAWSAVLAQRGTINRVQVARVGAEIASALAAAHKLRIVHRDVKPGNILIADDDGRAMISDFGISRAAGDSTLTGVGLMHGTPAYLAPEIARGGKPSYASDVFSLGSTLYAALEGSPPFGTDLNSIAVLHRVASGVFPPLAGADELSRLIADMLQPNPDARPSMKHVALRLAAISAELGAPDDTQPMTAPVPPVAAPVPFPAEIVEAVSLGAAPAAQTVSEPAVPGVAEPAEAQSGDAGSADAQPDETGDSTEPVDPPTAVLGRNEPATQLLSRDEIPTGVLRADGAPAAVLPGGEARTEALPGGSAGAVPAGDRGSDEPHRATVLLPEVTPSESSVDDLTSASAEEAEAPTPASDGELETDAAAEPARPDEGAGRLKDDADDLAVFSAASGAAVETPVKPRRGSGHVAPPPSRESGQSSRRRRLIPVTAAVVVLLLMGIVTALMIDQYGGATGDEREPASAASSTPSSAPRPTSSSTRVTTPSTAAPSTAAPAEPSAQPPAEPAPASQPDANDPAQLAAAVSDYYALMPGSRDEAWGRMTADYQTNHAGGRGGYEAFWADIDEVEAEDVTGLAPGAAEATLKYTFVDGHEEVERTAFGFVVEDGTLKIASTEVLSSG